MLVGEHHAGLHTPLAGLLPELVQGAEEVVALLLRGRLAGVFLEDLGAHVAGLVDAVAEAHHLFLAGQGLGDPLLRVGRAAGLQEEVHHLFVGPAVQPALEGPNGGHNSGVQIRFRGDDDARRERRGVELMFSIEDE